MSKQEIILELFRLLDKVRQLQPMERSVNDEGANNWNS